MLFERNESSNLKIAIDDKELEQVEKFKYLGQHIVNKAESKTEIKTRIAIARTKFGELKSILSSERTQINTRLRVLQCYVHSTLLYGCETWTLNKELEKKIEAFEMWTFRRMGKISFKDRKTNKEVCDILEVTPTLLNTIKTRKLRYFGHTKRHTGILKHIMEGKVHQKRPRGRPPRA